MTRLLADVGLFSRQSTLEKCSAMVEARAVDTVFIAKLDRLTWSVADLAELLKRFEYRGVSLVNVADALALNDQSAPGDD